MSLKIVFIVLVTLIALSTACNNDDDFNDSSSDDTSDSDDTLDDPPDWIGSSWELDAGTSSFWVKAYYGNLGAFLLHYKDGLLNSILPGGEWEKYIGLCDAGSDYFLVPAKEKAILYMHDIEEISVPYPIIDHPDFGELQPYYSAVACLTSEYGYFLVDYDVNGFMVLLRIDLNDGNISEFPWPEGITPYISALDCQSDDILAPFDVGVYRFHNNSWESLGVVPDHMGSIYYNGWIRDNGDKVWTLTYAPDSFPEFEDVPYGGLVPSLLGILEEGVHTQIEVDGDRYTMLDRAAEGDLFLVHQTWGTDVDNVWRLHVAVVEYLDGSGFSSELALDGAADVLYAKDISSPSPDTVLVLTETRENIQNDGDDVADDMAEEKSSTWDSRGIIWVLEDGAFRKVEMPEELQDSKISWDGIHAVAP